MYTHACTLILLAQNVILFMVKWQVLVWISTRHFPIHVQFCLQQHQRLYIHYNIKLTGVIYLHARNAVYCTSISQPVMCGKLRTALNIVKSVKWGTKARTVPRVDMNVNAFVFMTRLPRLQLDETWMTFIQSDNTFERHLTNYIYIVCSIIVLIFIYGYYSKYTWNVYCVQDAWSDLLIL